MQQQPNEISNSKTNVTTGLTLRHMSYGTNRIQVRDFIPWLLLLFQKGGTSWKVTKQNSSKKWQRTWRFNFRGPRNNHILQPCLPKVEFASCHKMWNLKANPAMLHLAFATICGIRTDSATYKLAIAPTLPWKIITGQALEFCEEKSCLMTRSQTD